MHAIRHAGEDDGLFLTLAHSIAQGRWLGPFNDRTLVKGPAYPLFIAAAALLHVPLKLAEQVCYLAASAALCRWVAVRGLMGRASAASGTLGGVLFLLLCFLPVLWTVPLARVIREGLYGSLSLAVVTLALACGFPDRQARTRTVLLSGAGLGAVGGAFWLTREEGLWLLPSLAVVVGTAAWRAAAEWRAARRGTWPAAEPPGWRQAAALAMAALTAGGVLATVAGLNQGHYSAFELNEVKSAAFTHAYGALSRIEPARWQRYIVFPKDARDAAYAASPAARELAPLLESNGAQFLASVYCSEYAIAPCLGFHAGWFQWFLRDAVSAAGHYGSAADAARFYRRLAAEIDAACDSHRLRCLPPRRSLVPPFHWEYVPETLREIGRMVRLLATLGVQDVGQAPSEAAGGDLDAIADMVGPVAPGVSFQTVLHGWAATPGGVPSLSVVSHLGLGRFISSVELEPEGDVERVFPGLHAAAFTIDTSCPRADCDLLLSAPGQAEIRMPIAGLVAGRRVLDGTSKMFLLQLEQQPAWAFTTGLDGAQARLARWIAAPYRAARLLWPLALAALVVAAVLDRHRSRPVALYALALASLAAVASRVVLLSFLQVTSIPSRSILYLSPAMPFLIVFIVVALFLGGASLVRTWDTIRDKARR